MRGAPETPTFLSTAEQVRRRLNASHDRLWRSADFKELPAAAVARTLSRMHREGTLSKARHGVYYKPRETVVGPSRPTTEAVTAKVTKEPLVPSGLTAAAFLGFTTQSPAIVEYATTAANPPSGLKRTVVHTRRPVSRRSLSTHESAVLEFLRDRGKTSDLSPAETLRRTLVLVGAGDTYKRLVAASHAEPPRVRAMLGSLGEEIGASDRLLRALRGGLNPLSRYEFGVFRALPSASRWYAK